jgi:hypothetical protein
VVVVAVGLLGDQETAWQDRVCSGCDAAVNATAA